MVKSNSLDDILQLGDFLCLAILIGGFFNLKQSKSKIMIQAKNSKISLFLICQAKSFKLHNKQTNTSYRMPQYPPEILPNSCYRYRVFILESLQFILVKYSEIFAVSIMSSLFLSKFIFQSCNSRSELVQLQKINK